MKKTGRAVLGSGRYESRKAKDNRKGEVPSKANQSKSK